MAEIEYPDNAAFSGEPEGGILINVETGAMRLEKDGFVYYCTNGLSMWPTLISNDILRTERSAASELTCGSIVVLPEKNGKQVVHRLISISVKSRDTVLLSTAGDRSGDDDPLQVDADREILEVTAVLRRGKWKRPGRKPLLPVSLIPLCVIRLHCRLIRKFDW